MVNTVLYVDDEVHNLEAFQAAYRRTFTIYTATSGQEARKVLEEREIAVLVSDQRMPGETGAQVLEKAVLAYPDQVRILVTAFSDIEAVIAAINKGYIFRYHKKPWDNVEMLDSLNKAVEKYNQIKYLNEKLRIYENQLKELKQQIESNSKK